MFLYNMLINFFIFRAVLLICCLYLSLLHIYRQVYEYGSYTLDITGKLYYKKHCKLKIVIFFILVMTCVM
jgi:hypothetical protein